MVVAIENREFKHRWWLVQQLTDSWTTHPVPIDARSQIVLGRGSGLRKKITYYGYRNAAVELMKNVSINAFYFIDVDVGNQGQLMGSQDWSCGED